MLGHGHKTFMYKDNLKKKIQTIANDCSTRLAFESHDLVDYISTAEAN